MPWSGVKGHELAKEFLQRAIKQDRVSHAYLFVGPRGIGKAMTARLFVQTLLCPHAADGSPCDRCSPCRRIERDVYPDVHRLEPDGDVIRIEQIRQLQNTLALKPFEAVRKAVIIDRADAMTTQAQNALLKVLEEPPGEAYFVLISDRSSGLLPTIWSRCQVVRFQTLPREIVAQELVARGIEEGQAGLLAALTEGRLGQAIDAAEQDVIGQRDQVIEWIDDLADRRTGLQAVLRIGQVLEEQRDNVPELLNLFLVCLRDILLVKEGLDDRLANEDLKGRLIARAESTGTFSLTQSMKAVDEARRHLQANANLRLTLDVMLAKVQRSLFA